MACSRCNARFLKGLIKAVQSWLVVVKFLLPHGKMKNIYHAVFPQVDPVCIKMIIVDKVDLIPVVSLGVPSASRCLSASSVLFGKRRKEPPLRKWGLEKFPEEDRSRQRSPLTDLPDFTYLDGRPTPLTKEQLEKKEKNYHLAKRIVMLVKEMEDAKAAHVKRIQDEATRRENILNSKLKQKSDEL